MSSSLLSGYGRYLVVKRLQPPHSRHSSTLPRRPLSELRRATELDVPVASLPERAKVVVCGGGAQGAAIAYALAKRGLAEETVLIDKGVFGSGSTLHSSGLIPLLKQSPVETKLSKVSKALYLELEEQGFYSGWRETGSLYVAQTAERMHFFKRMKSNAVGRQVDCHILTPSEIKDLCPLLKVDDLKGGLHVPGDGVANPLEICLGLVHLCHGLGVHVIPHCEVKTVLSKDGAVSGVDTSLGHIDCEHFVNTAGMWARYVGILSQPRVQIPMHAAEHYILHSVAEKSPLDTYPVIRDPDGRIYVRDKGSHILAGGFEEVSKPAFEDGQLPDYTTTEPSLDWDHVHQLMESLLNRIPSLSDAKFVRLTNDPEPYSPDVEWILGQAPEIKNYYVAAGMRSSGAGATGGVGEIVADYVTLGKTSLDMLTLDIKRFLPIHNNRKFLRDRVTEVPGRLFSIPYPFPEFKKGRQLRTSPIFTALRDCGARFNQVMAYERPMYFKGQDSSDFVPTMGLDSLLKSSGKLALAQLDTFYKPVWFDNVQAEFIASRETCSLSDLTSFAKMEVRSSGLEVVNFLQYLCSGNIDIKVGSMVYSGMQNDHGGYENDCTVARMAPNRFMLMSPSQQQMRSYSWLKKHLPADGSVYLQDVSSLYTALCLMGPKSKDVLSKVTPDEDDKYLNRPAFSVYRQTIGHAPNVITVNVTPTGELGYVFYIPNEFGVHVFDTLLEAGREFGIRQCGYYALRALRIEKFYAFWGSDLDSASTPLECGRDFRTKTGTSIPFIGKEALLKQKEVGVSKLLVMLLFNTLEYDHDTDPWPWGGEPIYRNGKYVGSVTTASYGFSLRKMVAIGFVHDFDEESGTKRLLTREFVMSGQYEVEIAGERFPVEVKLNSPAIPKKVTATQYQPTRHEV